MTKAKADPIAEARAKIYKERGLKVGPISEMIAEVEGLTTGNVILDYVTGVGGLPKGRLIELYGLQGSGKTTTALQTAAHAQQAGIVVAYFDYENALDPEYCAALGLDVDAPNFLLSQPDTLEQGVNAILDLMRAGVGLIVVDSVAQMMPEKEFEADVGEQQTQAMYKARVMAEALRKIPPVAARTGCCVVFTNHIREVINMTGPSRGKTYTTPGGNALKFNASLRVEFKPIGAVSSDAKSQTSGEKERAQTAQKVQVFVSKNKVARPFRKAELRMSLGKGFSRSWSALQVLIAHGVVKKGTGGIYMFDESVTWHGMTQFDGPFRGEQNVLDKIDADPTWLAKMEERAHELLSSSDAPVALSDDDEVGFADGGQESLES